MSCFKGQLVKTDMMNVNFGKNINIIISVKLSTGLYYTYLKRKVWTKAAEGWMFHLAMMRY